MAEDLERFQVPRFARRYVRMSEHLERRGAARLRAELLAGASGELLDVGCGNGKNFEHYPGTVRAVTAVEPDETLRTHAQQTASRAQVPVQVVPGHADALPVADQSCDVVVMTLVLCSVPDVDSALAEAYRVLRPGGELLFGEHVRATSRVAGVIQDAVTPLTRRFDAGCHQNRDTARHLEASPFEVRRLERFGFQVAAGLPAQPMISGYAVRPAAES